MNAKQRFLNEVKAISVTTLFFFVWFGVLLLLKTLILAEYHIAFGHFSMALIGALILAKVVLILEKVPLGDWVKGRPAYVDVLFRSLLYSLGVVVVILLEKGFEGRHEYGGILPAVQEFVQLRDTAHVWANTLSVSFAILIFNVLSVIRRNLGDGAIFNILTSPISAHEPAKELGH